MKSTVVVIIEKADNNFSAYLEGIDGIVVTGSTIEDIKKNMSEAIEVLKEDSMEFGYEIPEILSGEYNLVFI